MESTFQQESSQDQKQDGFNKIKKKNFKPMTAYQKLNQLLIKFKNNEISNHDVITQIQLRETPKMLRPYCKVSEQGLLQLHGVTKDPIEMYGDDWEIFIKQFSSKELKAKSRELVNMSNEDWMSLLKTIRSGYIEKYIQYNEKRIKKNEMNSPQLCLFSDDNDSNHSKN